MSTEIRTVRILYADDHGADVRSVCESCENSLPQIQIEWEIVTSLAEAIARAGQDPVPDLALLGTDLRDSRGFPTFGVFHEACPGLPTVILAESVECGIGPRAIAAGAQDVLVKKEFRPERLARAIRYTLGRDVLAGMPAESWRDMLDLIDRTFTGIVILDSAAADILYANASGRRILEERFEENAARLCALDFDPSSHTQVDLFAESGGLLRFQANRCRVSWGAGEAWLLTLQDVTERIEHENAMQEMAFTDMLTGLPNLLWVGNQLQTTAAVGLLFLDLDGFGHINEAGGMKFGNQVLVEVARRLRSIAQEDWVVRVGGDEFIVIVPGCTDAGVLMLRAQEIVKEFRAAFLFGDEEIFVTVSVGGALCQEASTGAEDAFRAARVACRAVKTRGRNDAQVAGGHESVEAYKRATLARDLHRAIERGQFLLYYQPRVHTFTGQVVACEALLRWRHPDWGMVSPADFIGLLERSGQIVAVGDWVIRQICATLRSWQDAGLTPIRLSWNVSPRQMLNRNIVDSVLRAADEADIDPALLELEVAEDTMIQNEQAVSQILAELHAAGVTVAIDDFGKGYSSILYLQRFRIQAIKIDRELTNAVQDDRTHAIVRHLVNMAQDIGIRVVAQGIETDQQLTAMREFGCDEIQGFYYSRPVPADEMTRLLRQGFSEVMSRVPKVNRRRYFRVSFKYPLEARMTITRLGKKEVEIGYTRVLIGNMGPGGLKFYSDILLPINHDMVFRFEMELLGTITVEASLVWGGEYRAGVHEYGVSFLIDETFRERLTATLNTVAVRMRRRGMVSQCDFVDSTPMQYFSDKK